MLRLSPAKLNLTFRLLRKRKDGFHEISSHFQAIDLFDRLFISKASVDSLTCDVSSIPTDDRNLILKASQLFRKKTEYPLHCAFKLEKRIPAEAGLGGGSSNAASALFAMNELAGSLLTTSELMELGAQLGSDVPFFFSEGSAIATGRGERIIPAPPMAVGGVTLAIASFGMSTPKVYAGVEIDTLCKEHEEKFYNDLEVSAFAIEPRLKALKESLLQLGYHTVVMSGSGSTFFCFGDVASPNLSEVSFQHVRFIDRKKDSWYHNQSITSVSS